MRVHGRGAGAGLDDVFPSNHQESNPVTKGQSIRTTLDLLRKPTKITLYRRGCHYFLKFRKISDALKVNKIKAPGTFLTLSQRGFPKSLHNSPKWVILSPQTGLDFFDLPAIMPRYVLNYVAHIRGYFAHILGWSGSAVHCCGYVVHSR